MTYTLDEIEALANAATPGPWTQFQTPEDSPSFVGDTRSFVAVGELVNVIPLERPADAGFVAAARTAIPELIARVRELEKELSRAIGVINLQTTIAEQRKL